MSDAFKGAASVEMRRQAAFREMLKTYVAPTPIDPDPDFTDKIRARAQLNERLSRIEAKLDRVIEMLAEYNSFMLQLEVKWT